MISMRVQRVCTRRKQSGRAAHCRVQRWSQVDGIGSSAGQRAEGVEVMRVECRRRGCSSSAHCAGGRERGEESGEEWGGPSPRVVADALGKWVSGDKRGG